MAKPNYPSDYHNPFYIKERIADCRSYMGVIERTLQRIDHAVEEVERKIAEAPYEHYKYGKVKDK